MCIGDEYRLPAMSQWTMLFEEATDIWDHLRAKSELTTPCITTSVLRLGFAVNYRLHAGTYTQLGLLSCAYHDRFCLQHPAGQTEYKSWLFFLAQLNSRWHNEFGDE
jgi:hypothetical protein